MNVGQVTETVEVAAQSPLLNTENASTGQIIENKRVTELPLNGRDFQQLQLLTPGTISGTNVQTGQGLSGGAPDAAYLTTSSSVTPKSKEAIHRERLSADTQSNDAADTVKDQPFADAQPF